MEYWIDGYFINWWSRKSWYSHERGVFIPYFATVKREPDRIYITESYARGILNQHEFDSTKESDMFRMILSKIINVAWEKEVSILPPTSLPDF